MQNGLEPASVTIRDVARAAGVSITTVSHVLSGHRPTGELTRHRVLAVVEQLNYRPNRVAQSLATRHTRTVGLILPDILNPFFPQLVHAIERSAIHAGYRLLLCHTDSLESLERECLEDLVARRVEGVIYMRGTAAPNPVLERLAEEHFPLVVLDEEVPGLVAPGVYAMNRLGGRMAARHLWQLGHRDVGVIGGPRGLVSVCDRVQGFQETYRRLGAPVPEERTVFTGFSVHGGQEAGRGLLLRHPELTAVFAANDLIAFGVIQAARELGRSVPGSLSVLGFDDVTTAAMVDPPLTTVRQPIRRMGSEAFRLLMGQVRGTWEPVRRQLPTRLVERGSTAPPERVRAVSAAGAATPPRSPGA